MPRWPFLAVVTLTSLPILLMTGFGAWSLWQSGNLFWLSWVLTICWTGAYFVYRYSRRVEIPLPQIGSHLHWTPKDEEAGKIVAAEQQRVTEFSGEQLVDPKFYTERSIELATRIARHYHPKSADPLGSLSVVELLTAVQLVSADLETMLQQLVPGSHLITVSQWRMLAQAPEWWRAASNVGWLASILFNPVSLARFAISRTFVDPVSKHVQTNLLGAFYCIFVQQLGNYLIELNSGRLRGGSASYREAMRRLQRPAGDAETTTTDDVAPVPVTVTIAIIGQVKAGKSSLVNCLLREQQAAVDVLPLTRQVQRYNLHVEGQADRLVLLDTPGYSDAGATREQMEETREAVRNADLVLLVLDVRSPAKQADVATLDDLNAWFREQHRLKPPPVIGIVSKIDGLSPVMEWAPPYAWEKPARPKEINIRAAVDFTRQTFGDRLDSIVPVCTDREHGRIFGIEEYLLPTLSLYLDEARACSLVRSLHRDYDRQRAWQVVSQLVSAGSKLRELLPQFTKANLEQAAKSVLSSVLKK